MTPEAHPNLAAAAALSRDIVAAADRGELESLAALDTERMRQLQSFRAAAGRGQAADRRLLQEIAELNERALGLMEHHRRIKGRALDLAATGRRAVTAYALNRAAR